MKPRLAVLVGAGASLEVGVPSTSELLDVCLHALRDRCRADSPRYSPATIVARLSERCTEYFGKGFSFEQLMHVLETIESLRDGLGKPYPSTSLPVEAMLMGKPHPKIAPALDDLFAFSAPRVLVHALHKRISAASQVAPHHEDWSSYVDFWRNIAADFILSIGSLNYDSVLEQALNLGPQDQGFAPVSRENVWRLDEKRLREVPGLMHLHGSIHFGRREFGTEANRFCFEDDWHDWYWHSTPESAERALSAGVSARQPGFRGYPKGPLITGYDKTEKLLMDPFGTYFQVFGECLRQTNRLLVVGYGFGDQHINALLQRMGRYHGDALRIAVITKFDPFKMHGAWGPERGVEQAIYHKWGRDSRLLVQMDYSNPLCAKSNLLRVYYAGVLDTRLRHMEGLIEFLAG